MDLHLDVDNSGNFHTRYVRTEIHSPGTCQAKLVLGSDDGVTVWLNGSQVHENIVVRGLEPMNDVVPLSLQAGRNVLVFRVNNATGAWRMKAILKMQSC